MSTVATTENLEATNQHFSVDADGKEVVDVSFKSEALGVPAEQGYGWPQLEFGETIGREQRYTIARKLGWGMHSSTWLARDTVLDKFVAIKVLTGYTTKMYERGVTWEADALRLLSCTPQSKHCVELLDEFTIKGRGSAGSHLCFAMPFYGGDTKALLKSRNSPFPLPLAKRIILHLLRGIAFSHERGIVHTDIKLDNILFTTSATTEDIERWTQSDPSRRNPSEMSPDGVMQSAISQPMKAPSEKEALRATFVLSDFGCAQPSELHDDRRITSLLLRAPEVLLGGKWDTPADIWTFGCLVYEIITARPFFRYKRNQVYDFSEMANLLYQMMLKTGDVFRAEQLSVWPLAIEYFQPENCYLKKEPKIFYFTMEDNIAQHKLLPDDELRPASDFLRRCLRLNPEERVTAKHLLQDKWLQGVE
ncbi:kinase-like protein [Pleurotus eryngii]|uniref:Kinase-like protein n=1 Tax=Pleurotus eryngii TaxID=5323 RepID=A0A9P6A096_PLEER|nr:kinase-like protein [Pleurotus eryngii]